MLEAERNPEPARNRDGVPLAKQPAAFYRIQLPEAVPSSTNRPSQYLYWRPAAEML